MKANEKLTELRQIIKKSKNCLIYAGIFSFFVNLLMLTPPLYMLQLYDRVVTSRSGSTLFFLTLIVIFLFICLGIFEVLRSRILIIFSNQLDQNLSNRVYDAIFKLSSKHPTKVGSFAMNDLISVKQYMSSNGVFAFLDAPWLPVYIIILFIFHPWYGWFSIFSAIILFGLALLNEKATKDGLKRSNAGYKKSINLIDVNLRNTEVINAMGMNDNIKKRWEKQHEEYLETHSESSLSAGMFASISKTSRMALQSLMLGLGALLVLKAEVSAGMMIAGSILLGRALAPLDLLIGSWKNYKSTKESFLRLEKFLEDFPVEKDKLTLPNPRGTIVCENLSLIPPNAKQPSLVNINLTINAGEMCVIIGPSAAGKSSLARALLGIWPSTNGIVRIDGADINQYFSDILGEVVGYLPQDVELFEGTVAENIARFGELDSQAIVEAAKNANVHDMILKLPNGYDTKIGIGGMTLSGGQRQRIALARAIYKYPKIIVLDEPNASLDDVGEKALYQTLLNFKGKATIVMISHKLNILNITDKIAVLDNGHMVAFGNRDEILKRISSKQNAASLETVKG